jgi:glycosyltransferase involved in cell wall biosynthesis
MMRVALVSSHDIEGGASRAAHRLHTALRAATIDSIMVVGEKRSMDRYVVGPPGKFGKGMSLLRPELDRLPFFFYPGKTYGAWSLGWFPSNLAKRVSRLQPDLLHLHWVGFGFMSLCELRRFRLPVIWTLHDMWPFTGGCHYSGQCTEYERACGRCPQLNSSLRYDLSSWVHSRKTKLWSDVPLTVVCPSRWLAERAKASSLLADTRIEVIPNAIDTTIYKPLEKHTAREILNLPREGRIIMFAAIDGRAEERKGYPYLQKALQALCAEGESENVTLLVVGVGEPEQKEFPLPARYLGRVFDDVTMVAAYSAADVFVSPSAEENLSNTVMEAMACGTPCVSFHLGGFPDLIDDRRSGYLATPFSPSNMAAGISWVLSDSSRYRSLSHAAREKVVRDFDMTVIAGRYSELYRDVIARHSLAE